MRTYLVSTLVAATLSSPAWAFYQQTNLVSDLSGVAAHQDPNLKNPWGVSYAPSGPIWVSDNMTGVSTIYGADGTSFPLGVTVPPPAGAQPPSAPTGQVYNATGGFGASLFMFASENGTISGWNAASGTDAALEVDNSAAGAVYKGLAIATTGSATDLYATNFNAGKIDVFNSTFAPVTLAGTFTDPNLPSGYAPFNIQNIGNALYVTFAQQDASKANDVPGAGHGFLDVFDTSGHLVKRLVSGGALNSPWGLALAPANFGDFSNALLVGNFGDGTIHAYDPATGTLLGTLQDGQGHTIQNVGLWSLKFGGGSMLDGATNTLFFTAGIAGPDAKEDHGLFGSLTSVPEPGSLSLLAGCLASLLWMRRRRSADLR